MTPEPGTPEGLAYVENLARLAIDAQPVDASAAAIFLEDGGSVARSLGIDVIRAKEAPLGSVYVMKGADGYTHTIIAGDERRYRSDHAERTRRHTLLAVSRIVRAGLARFDSHSPSRRQEAERIETVLMNPELAR